MGLAPEFLAQAEQRHSKVQVETTVSVILNFMTYRPGEWVSGVRLGGKVLLT